MDTAFKDFEMSKTRDPKPRSANSWWVGKRRVVWVQDPDEPRDLMAITFSDYCAQQFIKEQEPLAGIQFQAAGKNGVV